MRNPFFDFQEDEMSDPNIDYDSEEDETILDKAKRLKQKKTPSVTPAPKKSTWRKKKHTPKPVVMKKKAKSSSGKGTRQKYTPLPSSSGQMGIGARLRNAKKGPGSSPAKPICFSDTDTPSSKLPSSHTPEVPEVRSNTQPDVRRSLRMQAQGDTDSVLNKAQKRKKWEGSNSSTGMSLVTSFSYSRLTVEQC